MNVSLNVQFVVYAIASSKCKCDNRNTFSVNQLILIRPRKSLLFLPLQPSTHGRHTNQSRGQIVLNISSNLVI